MADPATVADFYGRWAGLYDVVATRTPGVRAIRERAVDALDLDPGDVVIEMGCGTGANLPILRDRVGPAGRILGIDLTPGLLTRARDRIERYGWTNVTVALADATDPPLGTVDAVLGTFVVGMFDAPTSVVHGWCDRVVAGGRITLLDAAPRDRAGLLDAAFGFFVAASAPPTTTLRYEVSPAQQLEARVEAARTALTERTVDPRRERHLGGFLRLDAGTVP